MIWFNLGLIVMLFFYMHKLRVHTAVHCKNLDALHHMVQANHALILLNDPEQKVTPEQVMIDFVNNIGKQEIRA